MSLIKPISVWFLFAFLAYLPELASAAIEIDGVADLAYGISLSTQNTNTQFGNNLDPDPISNSGGSEIDQVFGTIQDGRLFVTIAGNLEANHNKLEVFIDSKNGGFGSLGTGLPTTVDGYCCTLVGSNTPDPNDGALQRQSGLTFDSNFSADYYLTFSRGSESIGPTADYPNGVSFYAMSASYADLQAGVSQTLGMQLGPQGLPNVLRSPPASALDDFPIIPFSGGPSTSQLLGPALPNLNRGELVDRSYAEGSGTDLNTGKLVAQELAFVLSPEASDPANTLNHRNMQNTIGLDMAYDDSNIAGVDGASPYDSLTAGIPQNVTTGLEFSIPLEAIGSPNLGSVIRLLAFINGGGHDYASNQFSGVGVLTSNLGGNGFGGFTGDLSGVDLNDYVGEQFVNIVVPLVPEPSSIALTVLAVWGVALSARRGST